MKSPLCEIELDARRKEIAQAGNESFPISAFYNDLDQMPFHDIPWHYHEHIEVIYGFQGTICIQVQQEEVYLHEEEGLFLNTSVLHSIRKESDTCIFYSFVFTPTFISENPLSMIHRNLVSPLLLNRKIPYIKFHRSIPWQKQASSCILSAFKAYEKGNYGYELLVREKLSHMWYLMISHYLNQQKVEVEESMDVIRIKQMMEFLHTHFQEDITLNQIAKHANISEREVLRCFQKILHDSPISYLIQYRIAQAIKYLQGSILPITEISSLCGFDDPSYFAKVFKKQMHETPRNFRKKYTCAN